MDSINDLIKKMSLEEKVSLISGADFWHTKPIKRLNVPAIMVADGPHGVRKQAGEADSIGLSDSVPATCFPTSAALACTWNEELVERVGIALGIEAKSQNIQILLGPSINIKRSPLCGRNFEYYSEDPYLTMKLARAYIEGVQSQGVGTSIKHYVANNQEHRRMSINAVIDERTLREIYLQAFEEPIKIAKPWSVMCGYNKVNGELLSENRYLLHDVLRGEWGYEGFVVSDWGAVNDRIKAIKSGLDLEMPGINGLNDKKIIDAVIENHLDEITLDKTVERILSAVLKTNLSILEKEELNLTEHHKLARIAAEESIVLLKNKSDILPIKTGRRIAVIGELIKTTRYQGGGSSQVNPTQLDNGYDFLIELLCDQYSSYSRGYDLSNDDINEVVIDEAVINASNSDMAILFVGLPDHYESEGFDRPHMRLPLSQSKLIEEVCKVQDNVVIVLINGSPVEMPWVNKVQGILECYLGGQGVGYAIARILTGCISPSGKLAETFPIKLEHNPSYLNFPGIGDILPYKEGVFVGYRYYDTKCIEPLFPFGHGLSYASFEYSNIIILKSLNSDVISIKVICDVKNTSSIKAKEIVQLYIRDCESTILRPDKELKGFKKLELQPEETQTIEFYLDDRSFSYYDVHYKNWRIETGKFDILIGASSKDIRLSDSIFIESISQNKVSIYNENSLVGDILLNNEKKQVMSEFLASLTESDSGIEDVNPEMKAAMFKYMPLRALKYFANGKVTDEAIELLLKQLNINELK